MPSIEDLNVYFVDETFDVTGYAIRRLNLIKHFLVSSNTYAPNSQWMIKLKIVSTWLRIFIQFNVPGFYVEIQKWLPRWVWMLIAVTVRCAHVILCSERSLHDQVKNLANCTKMMGQSNLNKKQCCYFELNTFKGFVKYYFWIFTNSDKQFTVATKKMNIIILTSTNQSRYSRVNVPATFDSLLQVRLTQTTHACQLKYKNI